MGARIALYMDLENLVHDFRAAQDYDGARELVLRVVREAERRGLAIAKVACCDESLAKLLALQLGSAGVRTFAHTGDGPDIADQALVRMISTELPESADVVVIASGDHAFAGIADRLRRDGKSVVVLARQGSLSWRLREAADEIAWILSPGATRLAA